MPLGAIIPRYMKVFNGANPTWFRIHVICQTFAYVLGFIGWETGMYLGSVGIQYKGHRCIGMTLCLLATTQLLVGRLLRPMKEHKFRIFWNMFHYFIGYGTIFLSIVNVFKGIDILEPGKGWKGKEAYISILILMGCVAVLLEAVIAQRYWKEPRRKNLFSHHFIHV